MGVIMDWLGRVFGSSSDFQTNAIASVLVILLLLVVRKIILILIVRSSEDVRIHYRWRKATAYLAFAFGILIVGGIWFEGFKSLSTYLGLLSAGVAIALRDPLVNLAAWAFILWRRPFNVGDRIQIGKHKGDVIDQRIFMFTLMEVGNWVGADQSTGRVIHVPNGMIFQDVLANYSRGFQYLWNEVPVLVTFESNWKRAKEILLNIASRHAEHLSDAAEKRLKQAARKFMIFFTKLTPTVYISVKDSGVLLTIRYLCEPRRRRSTEQEIWEDILEEFAECADIDFAYPTQRFYNNAVEGKSGTRPSRNDRGADAQQGVKKQNSG